MFPRHQGVGRRPEPANDTWLRRLCARANVRGEHVHMHALRRTVISILLDAGNSLHDVSQWIGHHSTEMTNHYWERSPASLSRSMHLPWMVGGGTALGPRDGGARLRYDVPVQDDGGSGSSTEEMEGKESDDDDDAALERALAQLIERNRCLRRRVRDASNASETFTTTKKDEIHNDELSAAPQQGQQEPMAVSSPSG